MTDFSSIPVLDASALMFGGDMVPLAREFAKAYGEVGFAYITNHGIDEALIYAIFEANRVFHDLPLETKMQVALDQNHRGYIPINTSTDVNSKLAKVTKPNQSESIMMMREDAFADPVNFLSGPNQWPDMPGFRNICETYNAALTQLGQRLMQVALLAMGADDMSAMAAFETPTTWLRLLHYPPRPDAADDLYGSAPHTDYGALTILAQDPVGGLQVQTPSGEWVDAPPMPGAFVVNVGDMLHRMSNGRLRSTPHRVINKTGRERYSVPFFYDPHVSTMVAPLPGTGTPKFAPLHYGDFLRSELQAGFTQHTEITSD